MEEVLASMEQTSKLTANKISEDISKALDTRLNELKTEIYNARLAIDAGQTSMATNISTSISTISTLLGEISSQIGGNRNRSRH